MRLLSTITVLINISFLYVSMYVIKVNSLKWQNILSSTLIKQHVSYVNKRNQRYEIDDQ